MAYREYRLHRRPLYSYRTTERIASGILAARVIFILLAIVGSLVSCTGYDPALYPSYDVLNPGEAVRLNPISITADGNFVVNGAFIQWVDELKAEVIKLRKGK